MIVHALWDVVDYADLILDLRDRRDEVESKIHPRSLVIIERSLFVALVTTYGRVFASGASSGSNDFTGIASSKRLSPKASRKPLSPENMHDRFIRAEIDRISAEEIDGISVNSMGNLRRKLLELRNKHVAHADGSVMTHWTDRPHEEINIELNYISDPVDPKRLADEDLRLLKSILERQIIGFEKLQQTIKKT